MILKLFIYASTVAFIILWAQAAFPKFKNIRQFKEVLEYQIVPKWSTPYLAWLIPLGECLTIILLIIPEYRLLGFYLSFAIMLIFSIYIAGIVFRFYKSDPCPCGALFKRMTWKKHLWVNIIITFLAAVNIILLT